MKEADLDESDDFYGTFEDFLEDDEISIEEEGFMRGFLGALEEAEWEVEAEEE